MVQSLPSHLRVARHIQKHSRAITQLTPAPWIWFIRAEAVGQSTPKLTGKDWEEPSMTAANPVSQFSSSAWLKGAFKVSLGSVHQPDLKWQILDISPNYYADKHLADITDGILKEQNVFLYFSQSVRAKVWPGFSQGAWPYQKQSSLSRLL